MCSKCSTPTIHSTLFPLPLPPQKILTSCLLHLLCSLWTPYPSIDPETQSTKMLCCMKADTRRSASDEDTSLGMNWISWSHLGCCFMEVICVGSEEMLGRMLTLLSLDMEKWYNKEPEEEHAGSMTSGDWCHLFSVQFDVKNEQLAHEASCRQASSHVLWEGRKSTTLINPLWCL